MLSVRRVLPILLIALGFVGNTQAGGRLVQDSPGSSEGIVRVWPPQGERYTFPVSRDTGVSSVPAERYASLGGASRIKLKGTQEFILFDADLERLKGRVINGAALHIRSASPREAPLARVGISTISQEWFEGSSSHYRSQYGASSFAEAAFRQKRWSGPESTLADVSFGRGRTTWKFADCSQPDALGWQTCPIEPDIVAARLAGLSFGFAVADEVGNEWTLRNGRFQYQWFPNRFIYSSESRGNEPWLEVWVGQYDSASPEPVTKVAVDTMGLPGGEALLSWQTPKDQGAGHPLGFMIEYEAGGGSTKAIPRYLIPMAGAMGEEVRMHVRDLGLASGETVHITVSTVDSAGNVGQPYGQEFRVASSGDQLRIDNDLPSPFVPAPNRLAIGGLAVRVVDALDKINPETGDSIPTHSEDYATANHIFSASNRQIRLQSARNETVGFQVILSGRAESVTFDCSFPEEPDLKPRIYQSGYVRGAVENAQKRLLLPDPLIPVVGAVSIPSNSGRTQSALQNHHSIYIEIYVPHGLKPGHKDGRLAIKLGSRELQVNLDLLVWNFTLPNKLSFLPEMNAYETFPPTPATAYYRLAHEHRTVLNRLPYGWEGLPALSPIWDGEGFEWESWDETVTPLLDGSAFEGLPREGQPVDVFYLPFSENWPISLFENYTPSYWPEEAFSRDYSEDLAKAFRLFASHVVEKGWKDTVFQFYLNNKVYHRERFARNSAPWIFDEPVNTQDFWALRWYGLMWQRAVRAARGEAKLWFRGDISFSQFGRDFLWGIADIEYLGAASDEKAKAKLEENLLSRRSYFAEYGTANAVTEANTQPVAWSLSAWARGSSGVLPWQTIGTDKSWMIGEQTALFYPDPQGPFPSVRLKAFMTGQQLIEYLTMTEMILDLPRQVVSDWLKTIMALDSVVRFRNAHDAGTAIFSDVSPYEIWALRYRIGSFLDKSAPPYREALFGWETPPWRPDRLPNNGYVSVAPREESRKPRCDDFRPR